jgi:pyruvate/2-oxoglutarate dehydrogenase complex dihydrolipoamide dehydrogenase (E3) component
MGRAKRARSGPRTAGLNLEGIGVRVGATGIEVDDCLETAARGVDAAGDVVGATS